MATRYMGDWRNGNNANDASSFANRVRGWTAGMTAARQAPGDNVRGMASITGSLSGCSITAGAGTLTLPSGNHKQITLCDSTTGWATIANITTATSTTRVEGANSLTFTPATGFTTGPFAIYDIGATTDLSAYSAIHCMMDCGNVSQTVTLKLCSDAGGTVVVNTMTLPCTDASSNFRSALFVNGAALSSTVRSLVFEVNADPGTTLLRLDAIFACHDPVVTPNSITPWAAFSTQSTVAGIFDITVDASLQAIRHFLTDTTATLLGSGTSGVQTNCVWPHATLSSGTLYVWHAGPTDRMEGSNNNTVQTVQEAGTAAGPVIYEGGYNRTDMSTLDTDGLSVVINYGSQGGFIQPKAYTKFRRWVFICVLSAGANGATAPFEFQDCAFIGAANAGINTSALNFIMLRRVIYAGMNMTGTVLEGEGSYAELIKIYNGQPTVSLASGLQMKDWVINRSTGYGLIFGSGSPRDGYNGRNITISNSATADLRCATRGADVRLQDVQLNSATKISTLQGCILCQDYNGAPLDVSGSAYGLTITRDTATVDGAAVASMRLLVNLSTLTTDYAVEWEIGAKSGILSGQTVTASIRYRRTSANLSGRFVIHGGTGAIVATDQTANLSATAGTWDTATITFTAAADGVADFHVELWSTDAIQSLYVNPESFTVTAS